jgi:hypothetical protein
MCASWSRRLYTPSSRVIGAHSRVETESRIGTDVRLRSGRAVADAEPRARGGAPASEALVGRDSPQASTRVQHPTCTNLIPTRTGGSATVRHCGAVSEWDVLSGGRMGQVMGEDSTEVAPPATFCVKDCQAQNQVGGGAVVLGFPFPVPSPFRLEPRTP